MNFLSLVPLLVFVGIFLGCGIVLGDFYALPAPIAVFLGVITAFLLFFKNGFQTNLENFIKGCGDSNIVMMCLIVLLSGAFQVVTQEIGAVDTVVEITRRYLSSSFLYVGVFVLALCIGNISRCYFYSYSYCIGICSDRGYQCSFDSGIGTFWSYVWG